MKSINITEKTKQDFDDVQIELTMLKGKILSQDETLQEIIKIYMKHREGKA